jgi:hypothetical protein
MTLRQLQEALEQEIFLLSDTLVQTTKASTRLLATDEIVFLGGKLRLVQLMIEASKFATAAEVKNALGGNGPTTALEQAVQQLDNLTASDQNFAAILAVGAELAKAAKTLFEA